MQKYDAVVILGSRPKDPPSWKLPAHIYKSLNHAAALYNSGAAKCVVVSGKWTINFDVLNINQPFFECDAMAEYLLSLGIPDEAILREPESKDLISNIYYIKRLILEVYGLRNLLFVAAEARLTRIEYLAKKILGADYEVHLKEVDHAPEDISPNESRTLRVQSEFLAPMEDGDDKWLDGRFFDDPFYEKVKQRVRQRAKFEPFLTIPLNT